MRKLSITLLIFLSANIFAIDNDLQTLTFAQAGELAAAASADLKHSRASLPLLKKAWAWGIRAYFPQIGINVSENDRLQQIGADSFMKNYNLSLEQLIWDGGKISMSRKLERMELDLSSSRLDRTANEIAESAIAAYRKLLSSKEILKIKETALSILEEQRIILNEEVELGLALTVDLASADINLLNAKIDIYSLQLDIAEMEKQFLELLGLKSMPILTEKVDIYRSISLPSTSTAAALAKEKNPDLIEARYSITKKEMELKYISISWIPSLRLTGNFGLTGQRYPLTRHNWSAGIVVDFSNPWFQNRLGVQAGWEPPYDNTAMIQNSFTPLPDPAASYGKKQAKLALTLEQDKYDTVLERIGRTAATAVDKYAFGNQKRLLAIEAVTLGAERCRIEEIRLNLGLITRLALMETLIEQTQKEIAVVEAATALLEAEHELERFLDLKPGELEIFASVFTDSIIKPSQSRRKNEF
jgi:outer membrane protein TolC